MLTFLAPWYPYLSLEGFSISVGEYHAGMSQTVWVLVSSYAWGSSLSSLSFRYLEFFVLLCVCVSTGFPNTLKGNILKWTTMTKLSISKLQNCLVFMRKVSVLLYYNMSNSEE